MPLNSLNQEWDEEDPNAGIPQHERTDEETEVVGLPQRESMSSKTDATGVHIENTK